VAFARWCAMNKISFILSEGIKSDVTMTPRSRHELTYGTEAPLMDNGVLGTVFPMQITQLFSAEIDNCQASAH